MCSSLPREEGEAKGFPLSRALHQASPSYWIPLSFNLVQGSKEQVGKRVLLLMVLLHDQGLRAGYAMCCMGSARPSGEHMRATLKHPERLHDGWGMPASDVPLRVEPTSGAGSCRLYYGGKNADGVLEERTSWQHGRWLSRAEVRLDEIPMLLDNYLLSEYLPYVLAFIDEQFVLLDEYSPLLLHCGADNIRLQDLPEKMPRKNYLLSINLTDESMLSNFGAHIDTPQLAPFVCTTCSAYAKGFYDFKGGEFVNLNGMIHTEVSDSTANIGLGHRSLHTVLNLSSSHAIPEQPMLRASFVLWSRMGENVPAFVDHIRERAVEGAEFEVLAACELSDMVRAALGCAATERQLRSRGAREAPAWLSKGACIEARYQATASRHATYEGFYSGIVDALHTDGTCDVSYDDGDFERNVSVDFIRPPNGTDPYVSKMEGVHLSRARLVLSTRLRGGAGGSACVTAGWRYAECLAR